MAVVVAIVPSVDVEVKYNTSYLGALTSVQPSNATPLEVPMLVAVAVRPMVGHAAADPSFAAPPSVPVAPTAASAPAHSLCRTHPSQQMLPDGT